MAGAGVDPLALTLLAFLGNAVTVVGVDSVLWKTRHMKSICLTSIAALGALLIAGCAAPPELLPRSAANPAGMDLSGSWQLREDAGAPRARPGPQEEMIRIPPATSRRRQQVVVRESRGASSKGPSVHLFIESGKALKITQTPHGLFVSFDRAVVEEFTFGENRIISLGPIEAQRVSGWEGPVFVVETMGKKGATLTETWTLDEGGDELVREIGIADDDERLYFRREVFDRT